MSETKFLQDGVYITVTTFQQQIQTVLDLLPSFEPQFFDFTMP